MSFVNLYNQLTKPSYVKQYGKISVENGTIMYSIRMKAVLHNLGEVVVGSAYFPRSKVAIPVLILSKEQVAILVKNHVFLPVRKRSGEIDENEKYICSLGRSAAKKIALL